MKTSNLLALILSVVLSTGGFMAIDYLFTHASSQHVQSSAELIVHS